MNPTERIFYWLMVGLFFLAFIRMYLKWTRTTNPQVKFAAKVFLVITVVLAVGWFWL